MQSPPALRLREYVFQSGQLAVSTGAVTPPPRGKSGKGQLFVLVDADPAGDPAAIDGVRARLAASYYGDRSGSLTSALRRAIQKVNEEVHAANRSTIASERLTAQVACAVLRDDDLYLALVGDVAVYVGREQGIERVGRNEVPVGSRRRPQLGDVDDIGVEMFHRNASGLQSLVLASSDAVDFADDRIDHALLAEPENLEHLIRALAPRHPGPWPFHCLVASPDRPDVDREPMPPWTPIRSRQSNGASPTHVNGTTSDTSAPRVTISPRPTRSSAPSPTATPERVRRQPTAIPAPDSTIGPVPPARVPPLSANGNAKPIPPLPPPRTVEPDAPREEESDAIHPVTAAVAVIAGAMPRRISLPAGTRVLALRAAPLLALFLIGLFGVRTIAQIVQSNTEYASALATISQAEQDEHDALAATDPPTRQRLLASASQLAEQAYQTRPSSPVVSTATARIKQEYQDAVNAAIVPSPGRMIDLPTAGDRIVVSGDEIGVLDRTNSIVYLFLVDADGTAITTGANPVLLRKGDHVGSIAIGNLLQLIWMPSGPSLATPAWLILDDAGFLVRYDARQGLSLLTLPDSVPWPDVTQLAGSNGNLFVLSAPHQSLGWFAPQQTGFVGPATNYLTTPSIDLSDVTQFALDTQLFLLHDSGQIQSFTNGAADQFATLPPDEAPIHPAGIVATSDALFVGDPQRSRIIELSRSGVYQRALAGPDPGVLASMRDLGLSSDGKSLFVLSGTAIYRFAIPAIQ
jgi:hypothetical protein